MQTISFFVRRRPLLVYFILAYVFAWLLAPLILISPMYGAPGLIAPALAAVIVTGLTGGPPEVSRLLRKLTVWRVSFIWYLVVLGLPVILSFLTAFIAKIINPGQSI